MKNKINKKFLKFPKNMNESKEICKKICKNFKVEITFDDKWKNFGKTYHHCCCSNGNIECAVFFKWNYDLLLFAVMHELGHINISRNLKNIPENEIKPSDLYFKNGFSNEFDAWKYAIDLYIETFGRNISVKQARYMMDCLESYMPNYNDCFRSDDGIKESETSFWCSFKEKILR